VSPETFRHLFYECPEVTELRRLLTVRHFSNIMDYEDDDKKLFWFCGIIDKNASNHSLIAGIATLLTNYYI
jgi:hypothetical protein